MVIFYMMRNDVITNLIFWLIRYVFVYIVSIKYSQNIRLKHTQSSLKLTKGLCFYIAIVRYLIW
jgi:hypothetical protein